MICASGVVVCLNRSKSFWRHIPVLISDTRGKHVKAGFCGRRSTSIVFGFVASSLFATGAALQSSFQPAAALSTCFRRRTLTGAQSQCLGRRADFLFFFVGRLRQLGEVFSRCFGRMPRDIFGHIFGCVGMSARLFRAVVLCGCSGNSGNSGMFLRLRGGGLLVGGEGLTNLKGGGASLAGPGLPSFAVQRHVVALVLGDVFGDDLGMSSEGWGWLRMCVRGGSLWTCLCGLSLQLSWVMYLGMMLECRGFQAGLWGCPWRFVCGTCP